MMNVIGDLLSRDLSRKIEEIIQVHQADEAAVHAEISEYIATESIRDQYAQLLKAMAEAPSEPHEGVGVWISRFFGSGKSSFAKNLGYALKNGTVLDQSFSDLFKQQLEDERITNLLDLINRRMPTEVILFEVAKERDTRRVTERIAELMYVVLLRELGYAEDWDIAELEIELEGEGKLGDFVNLCEEVYKKPWNTVRIGAQKVSRASAVLHHLEPTTYPSADSWSHARRDRETAMPVRRVVERCFELTKRRRPDKALLFVIDEVGQHVAQSGDKIEDLRATVEEFGKVGKNLLKKQEIVAPTWIVVTSQERLDEVVAAIDSKRVELAKLQDRFRHRVDLAPSDIREVATKRVLGKKPEAVPILQKLYTENQGSLNASLKLERTTRRTDVTEDDFVQFYPYPPHYVELCIGIMSGIRLQPGAPRHYGGSNRTIIKQAYEMLVSERTNFASKPLGALVTLDKVYELVEGNLSTEIQRDINEIAQRFKDDKEQQTWCLRTVKVICLLEFLRDLPRTEANVAAFLIDEVGSPPPLDSVKKAITLLQQGQFIRNTEEGWKLQTAAEKTWDSERKGHLSPKPRDRNEIVRQLLKDVFDEPSYRTYRYKEIRTFKIGASLDDKTLHDGDLILSLCIADDADSLPRLTEEVRSNSRHESHKNDLYWVFCLTPEIDQMVAEVYASRRMVEKYDQMRAQQKISPHESNCLQEEKRQVLGYEHRLRDRLTDAMENGTGMFQGVAHDASSLGKNLSEIFKKLLSNVVPSLYPKLEMGSCSMKGNEAEEILKASADLKALSPVFYSSEQGLGLVTRDGAKFVCNPQADIAKEVLNYLISQDDYGQRDTRTGKSLDRHFGGLGYGWSRDVLRMVLALLFRAGCIQVSHGGEKFESYQDPRSRAYLTNNNKFKPALFTPVKPIDRKTLSNAVVAYEGLTGETVDMEKNAIAEVLKKFASEQIKQIFPLEAKVSAHQLPVAEGIKEYRETLSEIETGSVDDCVNALAGGGASLKESHDRIRKIATSLTEEGLGFLQVARCAVDEMWPLLEPRGHGDLGETVEETRNLIGQEEFYLSLKAIGDSASGILNAYRRLYEKQHGERTEQYGSAVEMVKGHADWKAVPEEMRGSVLHPLESRCCNSIELKEGGLTCQSCKATLSQMDSDGAALQGLLGQALNQVTKITTPPEVKVERVQLSSFFRGPMETAEQVQTSLTQLQEHLLKLLDEGVKIVVE